MQFPQNSNATVPYIVYHNSLLEVLKVLKVLKVLEVLEVLTK